MARDLGKTLDEIDSMPSTEFVQWMAFYLVEYELNTDTSPPIEYDDADEQSAAIDRLF